MRDWHEDCAISGKCRFFDGNGAGMGMDEQNAGEGDGMPQLMLDRSFRQDGRLVAIGDMMLEAEGLVAPVGTCCHIERPDDAPVLAEIVGYQRRTAWLIPLGDHRGLAVDARILPSVRENVCGVDDALLGRVIDGLGQPLDGGEPVETALVWPLGRRGVSRVEHRRAGIAFDSGVRAINGLLTIGEGHRIGLCTRPDAGKQMLLGLIVRAARADIVVIGLSGTRASDNDYFLKTMLNKAARARCIVVAEPPECPPVLRVRTALRATAIAEAFRAQGRKVLLILDSLTRIAEAQRRIALLLGEAPADDGYPGTALDLIGKLLDRPGRDERSGGVLTAIYIFLPDPGASHDPVLEAALPWLDGRIALSRRLADAGHYPPIDLGASVTRAFAEIATPPHLSAARHLQTMWMRIEDNRHLIDSARYQPGRDVALDQAMTMQPEMTRWLKQSLAERSDYAASVASLIEMCGPR